MELEKEKFGIRKANWICRIAFILFIALVFLLLFQWAYADIGRSIFDGKWTIRYTDCGGRLTIYKNVSVTDQDDKFITFYWYDMGKHERKLPLSVSCAAVVMERER